MAMSRTARILVAILLLAAAAFFWVNFYTQNRTVETPAADPLASDGVAETPAVTPAATDAEPATDAEGGAVGAPDADATVAEPTGEPSTEASGEADATPAADEAADLGAVVVAPIEGEPSDGPPTVVVDAPVSVGREIVVADLPFLVTEPRPLAVDETVATEETAGAVAVQGVTVPTRATVNPFSPVVVRVPPAPERDVPAAGSVVTEVPVPAAPTAAEAEAAAAAARASAPTPRAVAPAPVGETAGLRPLPTGNVLSSTPSLLREPRAAATAAPVEVPPVVAVAVPDVEATVPASDPVASNPASTTPATVDPEPLGSPSGNGPAADGAAATDEPAAVASPDAADTSAVTPTPAGPPPLAAGASSLARFLRDGNYAFTGSVVGPISVGVFRSDRDATPLVVALGQTLPDTDIVLTDLRGQQAELRLGDSTQILTLDLRR